MRLLNVRTLQLREFMGDRVPPYGILSHRWGEPEDEVTYADFIEGKGHDRPGYRKILRFCDFASKTQHWSGRDPEDLDSLLKWVWVDTCCIDKRSSAELSEAINSMFNWYRGAFVCYVYLADVAGDETADSESFRDSEWFTRGWTLQELLAPQDVVFVNNAWEVLGHKCTHEFSGLFRNSRRPCPKEMGKPLNDEIARLTNIDPKYLCRPHDVFDASVACRMSWAAERKTTRTEDQAYCLLGLFDVNVPLLYGEGKKAFRRLQEEIVRTSTDQSIFAWDRQLDVHLKPRSMLASSPRLFQSGGKISCTGVASRWPYSITHKGVEMRVFAKKIEEVQSSTDFYVFDLNCFVPSKTDTDGRGEPIQIVVMQENSMDNTAFRRIDCSVDDNWDWSDLPAEQVEPEEKLLYIR